MQQKIEEIRLRALNELKNVSDSKALDELRVKILGKKGELTGILRSMGQVAADLRPKVGQWVNETRESIENAINEAQKQIAQQEL
ncbi:MAG: phenylalanine--tRNA ligase subunit alpha, partial [Clostridia bacterium]|nr:phenylalanine--tRNA ligase subunit alpha [Clostridia bacterium]